MEVHFKRKEHFCPKKFKKGSYVGLEKKNIEKRVMHAQDGKDWNEFN